MKYAVKDMAEFQDILDREAEYMAEHSMRAQCTDWNLVPKPSQGAAKSVVCTCGAVVLGTSGTAEENAAAFATHAWQTALPRLS